MTADSTIEKHAHEKKLQLQNVAALSKQFTLEEYTMTAEVSIQNIHKSRNYKKAPPSPINKGGKRNACLRGGIASQHTLI